MKYVVKGFCCTTGNCDACHGGFILRKRVVRIINETDSRDRAERIKSNWAAYGAFIEGPA